MRRRTSRMRVLEEIRMLSGVETTKEKVLRIILAGQPELNEKLDAPELVQLTQRIRLRFHLSTLTADARCAPTSSTGWKSPAPAIAQIFAEDTFPQILPLHRRRAAADQHPVRHGDDGRLHRRPRHRDAARTSRSAVEELQWVELRRTGRDQQPDETAAAAPPPRAGAAAAAAAQRPSDLARHPGRNRRPHRAGDAAARRAAIIVGRTPDNDLQIDSRFVSRHHCQIITTADSCVIEDLNSTNGIYVKSKRVRRHYLNDGDVVRDRQARADLRR